MSDDQTGATNRRAFLKSAGVLVATAACAPSTDTALRSSSETARTARSTELGGPLLTSLGDTILPASLGAQGRRAAVEAFVTWCDEYEPVAEEMHGYGYADVRYLPADPVPAWHAQLDALDVLSQRVHHAPFTTLGIAEREGIVSMATRGVRGDRLPAPLAAPHIAVALLAHWASSPDAWNLALGAKVSPSTCRPLADALRKPAALDATRAAGSQS